jgi:hypothetical protein
MTTSATEDGLDGFIDATARVLLLPIEGEWKPAIKAHLQVTLKLATLVTEFALPDELEPAPVFEV